MAFPEVKRGCKATMGHPCRVSPMFTHVGTHDGCQLYLSHRCNVLVCKKPHYLPRIERRISLKLYILFIKKVALRPSISRSTGWSTII